MAGKERIQKKKSTAANKIKKLEKDLLSSQFSQQQNSQTQQYIKTPVRKTFAPNSLVGNNQSIFSPVKKAFSDHELSEASSDDEIEDDNIDDSLDEDEDDDEADSDSSTDSIIEIDNPGETEATSNRLRNYTAPLNTNNWQPLPPPIHHELSTLLHLLVPLTTNKNEDNDRKVLESAILKPLLKKFSSIYLPPVHKNVKKRIQQQRISGEFNLSYLNQEQTRLSQGYDINSKQLDLLHIQLVKEKEMLELEKKYVKDLKGKVKTWEKNKTTRIERLKTALGPEFAGIKQSLDNRSSGLNSIDDVDMVITSDAENDISNRVDDDKFIKKLTKLNKKLIQANKAHDDAINLQMALEQLMNTLER